jgi:hypothetical protein
VATARRSTEGPTYRAQIDELVQTLGRVPAATLS